MAAMVAGRKERGGGSQELQLSLRRRIYHILEQPSGRPLGRAVHQAIMFLIIANVVAVMIESVPEIGARYRRFFNDFEFFSVAVFAVEYLFRLWVCVEDGRFRRSLAGRFRYMLTPMAIVDLMAILPFFLGAFFDVDTRILRVLRLLRAFKLTRHFAALEILFKVIRAEARSLGAALLVLLVLMVLAAAGMYVAERDVQPQAFGSIPAAMWWAAVTLTTVGYGDVVPVTAGGRFFSIIIVILGVGIAALPAGIIAAGFTQELQKRREAYRLVVRKVLERGAIAEDERHLLEGTRADLGLDRDEASLLLHEEMAEAQMEHAITRCPHCGKPLEERGRSHSSG